MIERQRRLSEDIVYKLTLGAQVNSTVAAVRVIRNIKSALGQDRRSYDSELRQAIKRENTLREILGYY